MLLMAIVWSGMIWDPYDWLNKLYSFCMVALCSIITVVGIALELKKPMYRTVKILVTINFGWIWWITAKRQVFSPIFTISITFPMQMNFNSPKLFPSNFLHSLFAKVFNAKTFYYMVIWLNQCCISCYFHFSSHSKLLHIIQKALVIIKLSGVYTIRGIRKKL